MPSETSMPDQNRKAAVQAEMLAEQVGGSQKGTRPGAGTGLVKVISYNRWNRNRWDQTRNRSRNRSPKPGWAGR